VLIKGLVPANGIHIYYESFGDPGRPAVFLIIGLEEQCTLWHDAFLMPVVEAGYRVVRFDNRDTGLSTWIEDWDEGNPYTLEDMAADALGLLNALGVEQAHWVGASMGGMIAQRIALHDPGRVHTLTLIGTSGFPLDPDPALQPVYGQESSHAVQEVLASSFPNYLTDPAENIEYRVEAMRHLAGSRFPFETEYFRNIQEKNIMERKGYNPEAQAHHFAAVVASGSLLDELRKVHIPAVVFHGTEDPLLHPGHAEKLAGSIAGAQLAWMKGVGHELPSGVLEQVHKGMLELFDSACS